MVLSNLLKFASMVQWWFEICNALNIFDFLIFICHSWQFYNGIISVASRTEYRISNDCLHYVWWFEINKINKVYHFNRYYWYGARDAIANNKKKTQKRPLILFISWRKYTNSKIIFKYWMNKIDDSTDFRSTKLFNNFPCTIRLLDYLTSDQWLTNFCCSIQFHCQFSCHLIEPYFVESDSKRLH